MSSGVVALDGVLGGLIPGDNIVWVSEDEDLLARAERSFLEEGRRVGARCSYVTTTTAPASLRSRLGRDVTILDARPQGRFADPVLLEQTLVEEAQAAPPRVVIDGLRAFARRWGAKRALGFFTRVCPTMFDRGALAYWRVSRRQLGSRFVEELTKVTQCVLEADRRRLRVLKAEGRMPAVEGRLFRVALASEEGIELEAELAVGRLGEGLARLRQERNLSQADVARIAGVSPSAISQAEAGRRGLSLDTLLTISQQLRVSLDDLLANDQRADYVLARRDRLGMTATRTPLLDDPTAGLRAYLIHLAPGESGTPPIAHKGVELVLVAGGLVQVDLGSATPVMRAGDALLALRVPVSGWRNLLGEPARVFWIVRD